MIHRTSNRQQPKSEVLATNPACGFGFVVLCPTLDKAALKNTITSIKQLYPGAPVLCMVGNDASDALVNDFAEICETMKGHDTITSLINIGMKETKALWNVIVFAGSWLRPSLYRQFACFVKNEKDVLFQVVDGYTNFVDGSMNGIIIHKNTFAEVGDFPESRVTKPGFQEMELLKLIWSMTAIEKGCQFKAIIGMRVG